MDVLMTVGAYVSLALIIQIDVPTWGGWGIDVVARTAVSGLYARLDSTFLPMEVAGGWYRPSSCTGQSLPVGWLDFKGSRVDRGRMAVGRG